MSAIRLKLKNNTGNHDLGVSKFLGKPVLPHEWIDEFDETVLFLLQINLEEIKDLDKDNKLPHKGHLYFFLDTVDGDYSLHPIVRYYDGIPTDVVDDFNSIVPGYEDYIEEYLIEFESIDDGANCTKLLGYPSDWNYQDEPKKLLLQFDPLDPGIEIFDYIDGLFYFFFGENDEKDFSKVTLMEEYS